MLRKTYKERKGKVIGEYLTSREVSKELGIEIQSVSLYHRKYGIGTKENGRLYFTRKDLEEIRNTDGRRQ